MGVARDLGLLHVAPGLMVVAGRGRRDAARSRSCWSPPGRRASRCRRWAGWPAASTTRSPSRPATPSSSRRRWCPGNETAVYKVINGLARLGATVVHKETARVHVSGHAPAGELRTLLNVAKPRYLMPVHGEWRHLRAHAALAEETGMSARPGAARRGRRGRRPGRRQGLDRRQRADRQRLRRRAQRRRRGGGVAAGAADPRRRGLRRADRRHRARRPAPSCATCTCPPAASPTTRPPSTARCSWSRRTSSGRCRTTRSTRTGSRR